MPRRTAQPKQSCKQRAWKRHRQWWGRPGGFLLRRVQGARRQSPGADSGECWGNLRLIGWNHTGLCAGAYARLRAGGRAGLRARGRAGVRIINVGSRGGDGARAGVRILFARKPHLRFGTNLFIVIFRRNAVNGNGDAKNLVQHIFGESVYKTTSPERFRACFLNKVLLCVSSPAGYSTKWVKQSTSNQSSLSNSTSRASVCLAPG